MKKLFFLTLLVLVCSKTYAQFSDPWYNWYYGQQMMLNQQMMSLQMQQHAITEYYRQQANRATYQFMTNPLAPLPAPTPRPGGTTEQRSNTSTRVACTVCKHTNGACVVCKGSKKQTTLVAGYQTKTDCRNCNATGLCPVCGGDGWK